MEFDGIYLLVMTNIAMENDHVQWKKNTMNGDVPQLCFFTRGEQQSIMVDTG